MTSAAPTSAVVALEPLMPLVVTQGGALKPTTISGLWAHAACMQWIPEVTAVDFTRMEPIDRIQDVQKERWELTCSLCRQKMGAKIQCTVSNLDRVLMDHGRQLFRQSLRPALCDGGVRDELRASEKRAYGNAARISHFFYSCMMGHS